VAQKYQCDPVVALAELFRAGRWDVPENQQAGQRLLTRYFSAEELEYLFQQRLFKRAVAMMQTLTDMERIAALGQKVLADREKAPRRSGIANQCHRIKIPKRRIGFQPDTLPTSR
jgi:hypothetical protein